MTSLTSKIEYMFWPGPLFIPHDYNTHVDNLRQVSQITYYGPFGQESIYIDYDEECDDIYIKADVVYSVDAGKILSIRDKDEDVFLYDITVGEILKHLIIGNFDVCITWAENGRPDSVLSERVFQAPLSQIEIYHMPCNMPCIPEESIEDLDLEKAFHYGFELGYNAGVSDKLQNEIDDTCKNDIYDCCANCDRMRESQYNSCDDY